MEIARAGAPSTLPGGGGGGGVASSLSSLCAAAGKHHSLPTHCHPSPPRGPVSPCAVGEGGSPPYCLLIGGDSPTLGGSSDSTLRGTQSSTSRNLRQCCSQVMLGGGSVWHFDSCKLK